MSKGPSTNDFVALRPPKPAPTTTTRALGPRRTGAGTVEAAGTAVTGAAQATWSAAQHRDDVLPERGDRAHDLVVGRVPRLHVEDELVHADLHVALAHFIAMVGATRDHHAV